MAIIDLQQRIRELGRIRIGQVVPTSKGGTRPAKIDQFRLTSASKPLLDQVAALYGGTVREWTPAGGGPTAWEVLTDSDRLPVLVPPQPVSQWYELWSGGGCQRRCDGQREVLRDVVCPCGPDPADRECKPTTRLNVVLRDVPGVGVWRLESHGYYAAVELPAVAELLAQTRGYIQAWLGLEERTAKRNGKTLRWMVPILEVDITPAALMSGQGGMSPVAAGQQAPAVAAPSTPAIESGPAPARDWLADLDQCRTADQVRALYRDAVAAEAMTPELAARMTDYAATMAAVEQGAPVDRPGRPEPIDAEPVEPAPAPAPAPAPVEGDPDALWMQIVAACPEGWTTSDLITAYAARHQGQLPDGATAGELAGFLSDLRGGWVQLPGGAPATTLAEPSGGLPF